jgi:alpha-glucosidase
MFLNRMLPVVAVLLLAAATARAAAVTVGPATSYLVKTNEASGNRYIEVQLGTNGVAEVVPFADDVVRVRYHFAGLYEREEIAIAKPFTNWPAFSLSITNVNGTNLVLETALLKVDMVLSNTFQVHFREKAGHFLLQDSHIEYDPLYYQADDGAGYQQVVWPSGSASVSNLPSGFKLKAVKVMPTNEAYFGAGGFATALNRRGARLQYWNQDTFQWEESRNPMYLSLPFYYGMRPAESDRPAMTYGLFFDNPARPVITFAGGAGDTYSFEAGDDQLDYFFFGGGSNHSPRAVLDRYSELTGRPAMLPRWALGYHQSRHSYASQDAVQELAEEFRAQDFPCDAIYLDIDTQNSPGGNRQQLTFNANFTNVAGMIAFVTNRGMRAVPLIEPCLHVEDPLYGAALTNLYFLKENDLSTYVGNNFLGDISWLDFSIGDARAWWLGQITNYLAQYPFEAIWNDLNEPNENALPLNALYYLDGRYGGGLVTNDTRKWHASLKNTYNVMECSLSYQALKTRNPARRPFVLSRSGWPGIARYAIGWSGDNVASYEHLRHNIRLGTSVMISGQPNYGHDIGGFSGDVDDDLFTRWLAMGALQPFCRNHTFSANREPWLFSPAHVLMNRRLVRFRYEIMPYLYSLSERTATSGIPMNTPTFFEFPGDTNTYALNDYDFMVGSHVLAAPVYVSGATTRGVYLPGGGNWFSWQYDERHQGGQTVEEPASLGTLPLYVREGAIVPMGPVMNHANAFEPEYLDIHIWPGAAGEFALYEDDGETTNYLSGAYARTRFTSSPQVNGLAISAAPREGGYDPGSRSYYFVVHAVSNAASVTGNGQALSRVANRGELDAAAQGWCLNYPRRLLTVKMPGNGAQTELAVEFTALPPLSSNVFTSAFASVSVAGAFNLWNEAARNMSLVSNGLWAAVEDLSGLTNTEIKFVANDQWAFTNWGAVGQKNPSLPIDHFADPLGSNIAVVGILTGRLSFTFNETSLRYTVAPATGQDSDGDGASDEWEWRFGLNPLASADAGWDVDGDGLANSNEFLAGGSPVSADTDGDGQNDRDEYIAGTELTNASSFFGIADHLAGPAYGGAVVSWTAVSGRSYEIQFATNLLAPDAWSSLGNATNITESGPVSVTDTDAGDARRYRIRVDRF